MLPVQCGPSLHEREHLLPRQTHVVLGWHQPFQVLFHEEAHPYVPDVAHDVWGRVVWQFDAVTPRELKVRNEQPMAARTAQSRLESHEYAARLASAGDASAHEQLDARDDASPEAHMLWKRPLRQGRAQFAPERVVVLEMQPHRTMRGLESDKREQRGLVCGI